MLPIGTLRQLLQRGAAGSKCISEVNDRRSRRRDRPRSDLRSPSRVYSRTSCRLPRNECSSVVTGAWGRNDATIRHHTLQKLEEVTVSRKDERGVFGDDRLV